MSMHFRRPGTGNPRRLHQLRTNDYSSSIPCDDGPILAVDSRRSGFEPRRPDAYETCAPNFYYEFDEQLTEHLLEREHGKIDYSDIARRVIFEGYFQFFEFLRVEVQPVDADFHKYPYGGFPPEAFHLGVTQDVLRLRHVGVMTAMLRFGLLVLNADDRGRLDTTYQEITLALEVVNQSLERAFREKKPLPPETPDYYRRAQFWIPLNIFTRSVRLISAKPALKLLPSPTPARDPIEFWS